MKTLQRKFLSGLILSIFFGLSPATLIGVGSMTLFASDEIRQPIVIGWQEFKPYAVLENGVLKGRSAIERHRLMLEADLSYRDVLVPSGRMLQRLKTGKSEIDVWVYTKTAEITAFGIPVEPRVFSVIRLQLVGGDDKSPPTLNEFVGPVLITVKSYKYSGVLAALKQRLPGLTVIEAPDVDHGMHLLRMKRAPYLLHYRPPVMEAAARMGWNEVATTDIYSLKTYMFVAKTHPQADALVKRLAEASARILKRRAQIVAVKAARK